MSLTTHVSVAEFFHEVVREALERACVQATLGTECYLVRLMEKYTRATLPDQPLGVQLARPSADPIERLRVLEEVGDSSLYITGFFGRSLSTGWLDADYYMNLGEAAYRELAHRMARDASCIGEVYRELATKFPAFVDVLAEIRKQVDCGAGDVVALYQEWLATRDRWIERRLRALGVLVDGDSTGSRVIH